MLFALLASAPAIKPVPFILDGMIEAQARVAKEQILAKSQIITVNGSVEFDYTIDVVRDKEARIDIKPNIAQPEHQILYYNTSKSNAVAYAYHPETGQYTQSSGKDTQLGLFIKAATPSLDDFVIGLIVPHGLIETRKRLDAGSDKWKVTKKDGLITMKYQIAKASNQIVVGQKDLRLRKAAFANEAGGIVWNISYKPARVFKAPPKETGAYQVAKFDLYVGEAHAASDTAKTALQRLFTRYEQPDSIAYTTTTDGETTTVAYSDKYAYQSDNFATWGYDGQTLSILNKGTGKYYSGPASRDDVIAAVAATGSRIELNLRSLIVGRNPYRLLLNDFANVKSAKADSNSGEAAEILSAKSIFAEMKITVAKKDGFVLRVESVPITNSGEKLPASVTVYKRIEGGKLKVSPPSNAAKLPLGDLLR